MTAHVQHQGQVPSQLGYTLPGLQHEVAAIQASPAVQDPAISNAGPTSRTQPSSSLVSRSASMCAAKRSQSGVTWTIALRGIRQKGGPGLSPQPA